MGIEGKHAGEHLLKRKKKNANFGNSITMVLCDKKMDECGRQKGEKKKGNQIMPPETRASQEKGVL